MNKWFIKHEKAISFVIAALFIVGIIWWSVAAYLSSSNQAAALNTQNEPVKDNAVLLLTLNGEELNYPYWVMNTELDTQYQGMLQQYKQYYNREIDPIFDSLSLKVSIANQLFDLKVMNYYAEQNELVPTDKELKDSLSIKVKEQLDQLKANPDQWEQIKNAYGSEKQIESILTNSIGSSIKQDTIFDNVKNDVAKVSRDEGLKYIEENFDSIKKDYEQVKAQHILITDEATANDVYKMLKDDEISFKDAAAKYSTDTANATSSGDLGWFGRGKMVKEFEDAAFNGNVNELIGPVKTQFGYHIINVQDKKVFNEPKDVFNFGDIYSEIENKVSNEKFKNWLVSYKEEMKFGKKYMDEKLQFAEDFNNNLENLDELEKLENELSLIAFYEDGQVSAEADTDYLAVYSNVTASLKNIYNTRLDSLTKFISFQGKLDEEVQKLSDEEIQEKITEIDKKMNEENADTSSLIDEKFKYSDVLDYRTAEKDLKGYGIESVEKAKEYKTNLENKLSIVSERRSKLLAELFYEYPSSTRIVQDYYKENPSDPKVKIAYSKLQIEQLKMYSNYLGGGSVLSMYLQQPIREIMLNIASVISTEESTNTKLDALEVGMDLSDVLEDENMKLSYLKQIKEIDSTYYKDIDKMIEEIETNLSSEATPLNEEPLSVN